MCPGTLLKVCENALDIILFTYKSEHINDVVYAKMIASEQQKTNNQVHAISINVHQISLTFFSSKCLQKQLKHYCQCIYGKINN